MVVDAAGTPFILKWHQRPDRLPGLERARRITDHLRSQGAPVPAYHWMGAFADGVTDWLQTALPGVPAHHLSLRHVRRLHTREAVMKGVALAEAIMEEMARG